MYFIIRNYLNYKFLFSGLKKKKQKILQFFDIPNVLTLWRGENVSFFFLRSRRDNKFALIVDGMI